MITFKYLDMYPRKPARFLWVKPPKKPIEKLTLTISPILVSHDTDNEIFFKKSFSEPWQMMENTALKVKTDHGQAKKYGRT